MDIAELADKLKAIAATSKLCDTKNKLAWQHRQADRLLLEFIDDEGVTDAFDEIEGKYE